MGAQITSVTSPINGNNSDDVPMISMTKHMINFLTSGVMLVDGFLYHHHPPKTKSIIYYEKDWYNTKIKECKHK